MPINSCQKGKAGERAWAKYLREKMGVDARRGRQFSGSPDSPDVVSDDGMHWEVKRVEKLNLSQAMEQAVKDADGKKIPAVAWKKNRGEWLVILRAKDFTPRR
jgi:Holliday junction resolvase